MFGEYNNAVVPLWGKNTSLKTVHIMQ